MTLALPILITAGMGYGVYHAFVRVPEFLALLFEGGRVARGAVLPLAAGAMIGLASSDKPRWDLALDGVTGPDTGQARLWQDGDRVLVASRERLEARGLSTGALAWTASMSDAIHRACRQCLSNCQNIGGKIVCTR
jgi:hypothetical protein